MPAHLKPQWFQILLALSTGPMHGSAIMEEVLDRTDGAMKLWPATLYGSLRELEDAGWIRETPPHPDAPSEGGRRRFHELTEVGQEVLRSELDRLRRILQVARERDLIGDADPRGA
jgi:DNA-binding PadR family transcriptional regulator